MSKQREAFEAWVKAQDNGATGYEIWQASRAAALEEVAVTAWNVGMDEHNRLCGHLRDATDIGSIAARAIRALKEQS